MFYRDVLGRKLTKEEVDANFRELVQSIADGLSSLPPPVAGGGTDGKYYASAAGAVGGANFLTGAVPDADDTAILQSLLSINGPKHIVIDRVCPTSAPLKLNSDTTLEFINGGAIVLKPNSNCNVLEDATYSTQAGVYTTKNLSFINLRVNGNGYSNGAFQQIHHRSDGWNVGLRLAGVENVVLVNPWMRNCRTFCSFINNFHAVRVMGAFADQPKEAPYGNLDGFKFCGPYNDLRVVGLRGYTKDDILSCVACDVWVPTAAQLPAGGNETNTGVDSRATYGRATNGYISNLVFEDTAMCVRVMSKNSLLDNHTFENVSGSTQGGVFLIDNFTIGGQSPNFLYDNAPGDGGGNLSTLTFKNVNVSGLVGQNSLGFFALGGRIRDVEFIDCHFLDTSSSEPFIRVHGTGQINNLRAQVKAYSGSGATVDVIRSSGQIANLFLNAISYERPGSANNSAIFRQEAGSTGRIVTNGLYAKNTGAHIAWSGGSIGLVHTVGAGGTGLLSGHGHIDLGGKTLAAANMSGFDPYFTTHHNGSITLTRGDAFSTSTSGGGTTPPAGSAPTALDITATPGDGQVTIQASGGQGATSYALYRGTNSSGILLSTSFPYTDTGRANGTPVTYYATATNANGTVSDTATATPQTGATPPPPPQEGDNVGTYPTNALVAHWSFEETSGDYASRVGSHTLTRSNNPASTTDGKFGRGVSFDRNLQQRLLGGSNINLGTGFTLCGWMKINDTATQILLSKWTDGNTARQEFVFYQDGGKLKFNIRATGSGTDAYRESECLAPAAGQRVFVALRFNGQNSYVTTNAEAPGAVVTTIVSQDLVTPLMPPSSTPFAVGGYSESTDITMNGIWDELSYYSRPLIENELLYLYNNGAGRAFPA
ncbi:LamG domain-containing protein [Hymenobacter mucosus]|uniref:Concanavalin A-like lectin/glucanases superfamily protein n=1 Tax=Hymenobacter mucosus TaxID=1411120 RepID=A0A239AAZ8_9BACT|nr:hypothetical protein [Hymenobacter mucosus]SNR92770.1 hypothetical protein SAMN06269173_111120 [Hymenobacter mucosus]